MKAQGESDPQAQERAPVGPVLEAGAVTHAVIATILLAHPDAQVQDRGSYLRVSVPGRCVLDVRALEQALGRPFALPGALEQIMPSFEGRLRIEAAQVVWEARTR